MRIVYDRFHYATEPIDLPYPPSRTGIEIRGYLQGRADTLADLLAFAATVSEPTITADELRDMAELGRRARVAAAVERSNVRPG